MSERHPLPWWGLAMSAGSRLVCLRTHTWYSFLAGTASPDDLLATAADLGYSTVALTDHASLAGAVEFSEAAGRHGVRPILGARLRQGSCVVTALVAEPVGYAAL